MMNKLIFKNFLTAVPISIFLLVTACLNPDRSNSAKNDSYVNREYAISDILSILNPNKVQTLDSTGGYDIGTAVIGNDTFQKIAIDKQLKIVSFSHIGYINKPLLNQRDFLTISKQKILFDKLIFKDNLPNDYAYMAVYFYALDFEFNKNRFKCLFFGNSRENTTRPNNLLILINLNKNGSIIFTDYQVTDNLSCMGDINKDGVLDYIHWEIGNPKCDSITFYSMKKDNSGFVRNYDCFVKVKEGEKRGYYEIICGKWPVVYDW